MNRQMIFDVVLYGIRAQGGPSLGREFTGGGCAYRGERGRRCAVGMWISDAHYQPEMEGKTVKILRHRFPQLPEWMDEENGLLYSLQNAHDLANKDEFFKDWEERMQHVAIRHNLIYTPPTIAMHQEVIDLYSTLEKDYVQRTPLPSSAGCNDAFFDALSEEVFAGPYPALDTCGK